MLYPIQLVSPYHAKPISELYRETKTSCQGILYFSPYTNEVKLIVSVSRLALQGGFYVLFLATCEVARAMLKLGLGLERCGQIYGSQRVEEHQY